MTFIVDSEMNQISKIGFSSISKILFGITCPIWSMKLIRNMSQELNVHPLHHQCRLLVMVCQSMHSKNGEHLCSQKLKKSERSFNAMNAGLFVTSMGMKASVAFNSHTIMNLNRTLMQTLTQ